LGKLIGKLKGKTPKRIVFSIRGKNYFLGKFLLKGFGGEKN